MASFTGIYPALVTPVHEDLSINVEMLRKLVKFHLLAGVDGLWVGGATAEAMQLTEEERRLVASTVVDAAGGRVNVIVHVGSPDGLAAARLAVHADQAGADAVASVPPFFLPHTEDAIIGHYRRLADSCSLPLFMYHLPELTQVPITTALAEGLLKIPQVQGIKFSEQNVTLMRQIKNLSPDRLSILFGMDSMLLAGLVMGADGGVGGSYNYLPGAYVRIFDAFRRGDLADAQALQHHTTDILLSLSGMAVPTAKCVMRLLGYDCGPTRPSLTMPSKADEEAIARVFQRHRKWLETIAITAPNVQAAAAGQC